MVIGDNNVIAKVTEAAKAFFTACEAGKGWEACKGYCTSDATFSAQAEPLAEIKTLRDYTEWMKGLLATLTDGTYDLKSFATDAERNNVSAYAVFMGTHLANGPCPPTGKKAVTDYVYVMQFKDDKIVHVTKIWNSNSAFEQLGWN
jgi:ketosteroid isomerase-like protein